MNIRKRVVAFIAVSLFMQCLLIFPAMAVSSTTTETTITRAAPPDDNKSFIVMEKDGTGMILEQPNSVMFWEYPELPAGQTREGTIKIKNASERPVLLSLVAIDLPYDDDKALLYLTALHITISKGNGDILYSGAYSKITGNNGLKIELPELKPEQSAEYRVKLHCAFDYIGDPAQETSHIDWRFTASATVKTNVNSQVAIGKGLGIVALVLAAAGVALLVIQSVRKRKY